MYPKVSELSGFLNLSRSDPLFTTPKSVRKSVRNFRFSASLQLRADFGAILKVSGLRYG
jgi:hypothetical protein